MTALILIAILSAFVVITGFVFSFTIRQVIESGVWCPWYVKAIAYVWLVIGYPADILFNLIWGTVIFRELPRELLFSSRVARHVKRGPIGRSRRVRKAIQWAAFMDAIDPGHI